MIKQKIDKFIENIPALPKNVKMCATFLEEGDVDKAANSASLDPAFSHYLIEMVNKPIFEFRNHIKDIHQIFGILGLERALQVVNAYYATLILPKKWQVFKIDNSSFQMLQSSMMHSWNKILDFENYKHLHIASIISLIPASFVVCEELFEEDMAEVRLLKEFKDLSYDEILYKISGLKIFDIFIMICKKWEMDIESLRLIEYLRDKKEDETLLSKFARYLHLLIFYELSKPVYISAGLNDFIEFDVEFVAPVYENFMDIVESV